MNHNLREIADRMHHKKWISQRDINPTIRTLAHDSRKVGPGTLFFCIPGATVDGHSYAADAVNKGAVAIVAEHALPISSVPVIVVPDARKATEEVAAWFYGEPAKKLRMIGVTGTNGKTTTTHIIREIFNRAGRPAGVIGTLHILIGDREIPVKNTTPDVLDLQATLADMVESGMKYAVMEVSSHALALGRVLGCEYDAAIFTNITQDHLDFHHTLENYREAKALLFRELGLPGSAKGNKSAIANMDDAAGSFMLDQSSVRKISYGINSPATVRAEDVLIRPDSASFRIAGELGTFAVKAKITGLFNVYNMLAAASVALVEGIEPEVVRESLEQFSHVPGRFERVEIDKPFSVIVDYAHTPDSLENVLRTAKHFVTGRLIAVFGCGGDRDRTKRPIMGELAARYADRVIVTSDNPRSEDPQSIVDEILEGITAPGTREKTEAITDRFSAIKHAMDMALPGDVLLIAGKGHETYQILSDRTIHFDDREVVRDLAGGTK